VHRDIKPENILLAGGHALVVDFGIARALTVAGHEQLTETGLVLGTPAYMSPEQSVGSQDVDARSDLYSLACVLYEMLAGEPPYTGPNSQAIMAKRITDPVPNLRIRRKEIPERIERAVLKALAKAPADRFAAATDFVDALSDGHTVAVPSPLLRRPRGAIIGAAILGLATVVAGLIFRRPNAPPSLALWHEGLMDLLSRNLDGAGALRTVSPSLVVRFWEGRADPISARALGQRAGASLVVFGELVGTGMDSVRLNATLVDVVTGHQLGDVEGRDVTTRIDRLADSVSVRLLRVLGRTRPVGVVRLAGFGSASLTALKAFLQGEQYYRRQEMDSAKASYEHAVELDSTFTLALRRLWLSQWDNESALKYAMRAGRFNHGLAPRESLLVSADSVFAAQLSVHFADSAMFARFRHVLRTLEEATRQYPNDPEVWYELGEARFHASGELDISQTAALDAFNRAVALDSSFIPAYSVHTIQLLVALGDIPTLRRWMSAALAHQRPRSGSASSIELVSNLLDKDRARSKAVQRLLDTLPLDDLGNVFEALEGLRDDRETAVRVARTLAERTAVGGRAVVDSFAGEPVATPLARALLYRGHLREAYATKAVGHWGYFSELALLGVVPADSASAVFSRQLRASHPDVPFLAMVPLTWWALHGDSTSLRGAIRRADSLARPPLPPERNRRWLYVAAAARAYLALVRADTTEAIKQFLMVPDSLCRNCVIEPLLTARLLATRGRYREAADRLKAQSTDPWRTVHLVLLELERGRISERLGERDEAIRAYRYVTEAWRRPDPELQPYVIEARGRLNRLEATH
jgi:serine/threonine-protein kinase